MKRIDETPSTIERIFGAVMASAFAGGTAIAAPWILAWKYPIKFFIFFPLTSVLVMPMFYVWILIVVIYALSAGFRYGFFGVLDIFNLIWRTGETNDRVLRDAAEKYRVLIPVTIFVSYLLILHVF
ncbi:hypothetical protein [Undibacterium parvum]|uniref:Uncharacterized protein n=2 Tax=Undibacterium TaxID=401469 RepID=A0A6M4A6E3_9BURK|nr:hypothetical protein [Undibacterium parvum]AZP12512.1 hypothetical protein EJN92_11150 [Undibacterium parvum]QJQ06733.1 hypothetical protein EJG51_013770 [Undibacterium piscinae]